MSIRRCGHGSGHFSGRRPPRSRILNGTPPDWRRFRYRTTLTDLAFDLAQKSAGFRRSLPPSLITSLADLVRAINCYYSNLIEGHETHPVDIERALKNDYSQDARKRDLQVGG